MKIITLLPLFTILFLFIFLFSLDNYRISHKFLFMDMLVITGNDEQSIPEGDGIRGSNSSDGNKSDNSEKCHHTNLDWREFRAKLYRDELVMHSFLNGIFICHLLLNCSVALACYIRVIPMLCCSHRSMLDSWRFISS